MLFIMTQQVQPAAIMPIMQSQQAWIIAQQSLSPLVQVIFTPSAVFSHLHMAMAILQLQTIMPFIMAQQEHIPPAIMAQRFWSIPAETLSSHLQVIVIPPSHFWKVIVQRGTITAFMPAGAIVGAPIIGPPIPGIAALGRSIIIALAIVEVPSGALNSNPERRGTPAPPDRMTNRILHPPPTQFKRIWIF